MLGKGYWMTPGVSKEYMRNSSGGTVGLNLLTTFNPSSGGMTRSSRVCPTVSSESRNTGQRKISARLKHSMVRSKASWVELGERAMVQLFPPAEPYRIVYRSPWPTRVATPLLGPAL